MAAPPSREDDSAVETLYKDPRFQALLDQYPFRAYIMSFSARNTSLVLAGHGWGGLRYILAYQLTCRNDIHFDEHHKDIFFEILDRYGQAASTAADASKKNESNGSYIAATTIMSATAEEIRRFFKDHARRTSS